MKQKEKRREKQKTQYQYARKLGLSSSDSRKFRNSSKSSIKKFSILYKSGANYNQSNEYKTLSLDEVKENAKKMKNFARTIAKNNNTTLKNVIGGMNRSIRLDNDWVEYIKLRKRQQWQPIRFDKKDKKYKLITRGKTFTAWKKRLEDGYIDIE